MEYKQLYVNFNEDTLLDVLKINKEHDNTRLLYKIGSILSSPRGDRNSFTGYPGEIFLRLGTRSGAKAGQVKWHPISCGFYEGLFLSGPW